MKKKGFTLVELLAVIAILAILVIIALPNVLSMYNEARKNTFTTEVKDHYKAAEQKFMLNAGETIVFTNLADSAFTGTEYENTKKIKLDMSGSKKTDYILVFNPSGDCTKLIATNGTYGVSITEDTGIAIENIGAAASDIKDNLADKTQYLVQEAEDSFSITSKANDDSSKPKTMILGGTAKNTSN